LFRKGGRALATIKFEVTGSSTGIPGPWKLRRFRRAEVQIYNESACPDLDPALVPEGGARSLKSVPQVLDENEDRRRSGVSVTFESHVKQLIVLLS
jgi:hypothetical protein